MNMISENKKSYFLLDLKLPDTKIGDTEYVDEVRNSVDLILSSMGVDEEPQQYIKNDRGRIIYFFRTNLRKRKGQLAKFCERYLPEHQYYKIEGITKSYLDEQRIRLENSKNYQKEIQISKTNYTGDDIKILDEKKKLETLANSNISKILQ